MMSLTNQVTVEALTADNQSSPVHQRLQKSSYPPLLSPKGSLSSKAIIPFSELL